MVAYFGEESLPAIDFSGTDNQTPNIHRHTLGLCLEACKKEQHLAYKKSFPITPNIPLLANLAYPEELQKRLNKQVC